MSADEAHAVTCIAPASSQSIGKANDVGAEHDTGPELASHKRCQSPSNEESGDDVRGSSVHSSNAENERSGPHEHEGVRCSRISVISQKCGPGTAISNIPRQHVCGT